MSINVLNLHCIDYHINVKRKLIDMISFKKKKIKPILHDISLNFESGKIYCILGPSGSGKSTLLDTIAGRLYSKNITGSISYNDSKLTEKKFNKIGGYVEQDDTLLPYSTVYDTILENVFFEIRK